jgi:hypothetical protein
MIGLDIRVRNEYNNYLFKLYSGINLLKYRWKINTYEFLYKEDGEIKEDFFRTTILNGNEFINSISRNSYYMIFADIKAYSADGEIIEIKTLEEFMESNCDMILICTDSEFIEFYCKDEEMLNKVHNNCIQNNFKEVTYISEEEALKRNFFV